MSAPERKKHILIIDFDARIKEGIIKRNERYKPVMSSPNAYKLYNAIYFTPSVLISDKSLEEFIGKKLSREDKQLIFLNNSQYNNFLKFLVKKNNPKLNLTELSKPGNIIEKNINFILNLFFGEKSILYLGDKEYTISNYEWNKVFTLIKPNTLTQEFIPSPKNIIVPNVKINIRFLLKEGKETNFMDSVSVSCAQKLQAIKNDYLFLTEYDGTTDKEKEKFKQQQSDNEEDAPFYMRPSKNNKSNLRSSSNKKKMN